MVGERRLQWSLEAGQERWLRCFEITSRIFKEMRVEEKV